MSQRTVCDGCGAIILGPRVTLEWVLGHSSLRVDLCVGPQGEPRDNCAGRVLGAIAQTSPGMREVVEASIDREDGQRSDARTRERERRRHERKYPDDDPTNPRTFVGPY